MDDAGVDPPGVSRRLFPPWGPRMLNARGAIPITLCVCAVLSAAAPSHAGMDLNWNSCTMSDANANLDFACDANDGNPYKLVFALRSPTDVTALQAIVMTVDVLSASGPLGNWWRFGVGGCRTGSLSLGTTAGVGATCAQVPWKQGRSGGIDVDFGADPSPVSEQLILTTWPNANLYQDPTPLTAGVRYVVCVAWIDQSRTTDDGSGEPVCGGCAEPVCLLLRSVEVHWFSWGEGYRSITVTDPETRAFVTWQGHGAPGPSCPMAVPTRNATWGAIKAMYR